MAASGAAAGAPPGSGGGEAQQRALLPFLQRAEEVQRVDPKVAYYCRMRAVEEGLGLPERSAAVTALLGSVMTKLEQAKAEGLELGDEDSVHVEGFAVGVFARADKADRAGVADLNTAKAFYAASVFLEVCTQFGELDEDLAAKQKYAAWKASDIRKALKRGDKPKPGGPNERPPQEGAAAAPGPAAARAPAAGGEDPVAAAPPPPTPPATTLTSGQPVLYRGDGGGPPRAGEVLNASDGAVTVLFADATVVEARAADVAPNVAVGDWVGVRVGQGPSTTAAQVAEVDASGWPPVYKLQVPGAPDVEVDEGGTRIVPMATEPPPPPGDPPSELPSQPSAGADSADDLGLDLPTAPLSGSPLSKTLRDIDLDSITLPVQRLDLPGEPLGPTADMPPPTPDDNYGFPTNGHAAAPPPPPAAPQRPVHPQPAPAPPRPARPPAPIPRAAPGFKPSMEAVMEAQKMTKYATSSLGFDDVDAAVDYLTKALLRLTRP